MLLTVVLPSRAYASCSTLVALVSAYCPYVIGGLTGTGFALWMASLAAVEYHAPMGMWKGTWIVNPSLWLLVGLLSNHLASMVERSRQNQLGMDELRESRHRIVLAHEQTRKEIAGLLHGRVQSRMVVLGHRLRQCQERLRDVPGGVAESLEEVSRLLGEIRDQELRSISRQLFPSIIRTGLPSALNSLADRFQPICSVRVVADDAISGMESRGRPGLDESLRIGLYRVAEEALTNVAKYSGAACASVTLSLAASQDVVLVIRDDGRGFKSSRSSAGHGILSMEDYVTALGGTLKVDSTPGMGTTVRASVPLSTSRSPEWDFTRTAVVGPGGEHPRQAEHDGLSASRRSDPRVPTASRHD